MAAARNCQTSMQPLRQLARVQLLLLCGTSIVSSTALWHEQFLHRTNLTNLLSKDCLPPRMSPLHKHGCPGLSCTVGIHKNAHA